MSTARHIYELRPDEERKRTPMPKKCKTLGCPNDALIYGHCWYCHEESAALDEWYRNALARSKRRAAARARFFAALLGGLKVAAGVSLYLACVVGLLWVVWRAR